MSEFCLQMPPAWKEYVTNVLVESGYVSKAAIVGHDGKRWATSYGFEVAATETLSIIDGYIDPSKLQNDGIRLAGKEYTYTRSDSVVMVGRSVKTGWGCIIYKCRTCLVIGVYEEGTHPGGCFNMVTKLGDYLKDQGL